MNATLLGGGQLLEYKDGIIYDDNTNDVVAVIKNMSYHDVVLTLLKKLYESHEAGDKWSDIHEQTKEISNLLNFI